ncbi:acyltransferase family protein [Methyloversatilis sp.]|uniref:acyltransferase family protein n=1 Tax=Methyloversatilis sp. TaxID=2569862 RepID=UPI0035AE868A
MHSRNIAYAPAVDQIRGVAALWIVFYHAYQLLGSMLRSGQPFRKETMWEQGAGPLFAPLVEGHTAVALFMVLSGFIFTRGAIGQRIDYLRFIGNRFLRIYPLYLLLLLVALAARPQAFEPGKVLGMLLPFADFVRLGTGPLTGMTWAIGVEFQFYLLFPLLFRLAKDAPVARIAGWIACLVLLRLLAVGLGGSAYHVSYWHLAGRLDQFLLGMAAAFWLAHARPDTRRCALLLGLSVPLALVMLHLYHRAGGFPSAAPWKAVWPALEGSLWALCVAGWVGLRGEGRRLPAHLLQWVGVRSFSIYLLHYPLVQWLALNPDLLWAPTGDWRSDALLMSACIVLPLTLVLSALTWAAIEKPFLALRRGYLTPLADAPAASAVQPGTVPFARAI